VLEAAGCGRPPRGSGERPRSVSVAEIEALITIM